MTSASASEVDQAQGPSGHSSSGIAGRHRVILRHFLPGYLPALTGFLNHAFAGHRHYVPIGEADFAERVLAQLAFDPHGLILAMTGDEVLGAVHAIKPPPSLPANRVAEARHHIVWLAVADDARAAGWAPGSYMQRRTTSTTARCTLPRRMRPFTASRNGCGRRGTARRSAWRSAR